ncbi:MAG: glycosyltransferase family 4 protein [Chloroflexi bacterium]|nr:glycosyltransferase family 4 protein [Chloroflexota bacterium]
MRIGFNTFFLQHSTTGSGQYCARLLEALGEIDRENEYHAIGPGGGALMPGLRVAAHTAPLPPIPLGRQMGKVWFEQISVPLACQREKIDVVHYPYFAAPLVCSARVVVTVHDLIPLMLDEYKGSAAVRAYSFLVATGAKSAAGIVADSECTRRDIVRLLKIPEQRVRVVYLAPKEDFRRIADASLAEATRRKYDLDTDFVFYLGGLDVRKNVGRLIQAFARFKRESDNRVKLAIAGKPISQSSLFPNLKDVVKKEGIADSVIFLGKVPEEDCPALYNAARLFVYPSLYEGFGLPPLEAMACGTPVVCSNASSLPEVVGDAAITVDPTNVDALAQAMRHVLGSVELQEQLRQKGLQRAQRFTWKKTAEQTLAAFEEFGRGIRG